MAANTTFKGMDILSQPFQLLLDFMRNLQDSFTNRIKNQEQSFAERLAKVKNDLMKELNDVKEEAEDTRKKLKDAENRICKLEADYIHLITKDEEPVLKSHSMSPSSSLSFYSASSESTNSADKTDSTQTTEPKEQPQTPSSLPYSSTAQRMMQKMGYKAGKGHGKYETGRVDIIEASKQRGQRGLGLKLKGLENDTNVTWKDEGELMIRQDPDWIPDNELNAPSLDELNSWVEMGSRKETIDDETEFIEGEILQGILENKSLFDDLAANELTRARSRAIPANPFGQGKY